MILKFNQNVFLLLLPLALSLSSILESRAVDIEEWERELVDAWTTISDCSPSTGMCEHCGFGAAIVDYTNGTADTRFYTAGPDGLKAPFGPFDNWEIASITKPFTALATLIMEDEGILSAEDTTISDYLDCNWEEANSEVGSVTLLEIIQHKSGLPAQPPDRGPTIEGNPFANYTSDRLCDSLLNLNNLPTRGRYSYSNYAYGTLGYVLTLAVDKENPPSYEDVVKERILNPLKMTDTSVTYDDDGWAKAAPGCARGIRRGEETIRLGAYDTLQGNGALRSTLNDMAKYLHFAMYVDAGMPPPTEGDLEAQGDKSSKSLYNNLPPATEKLDRLYRAMKRSLSEENKADEACTCVSGWCEGLLCPLPNPNNEFITPGGIEGYTSGRVQMWRKSGDTGGYSSRFAYSAAKGRGAVAIDTCGGCGSKGTAGSGAQRAALLLADGPPTFKSSEAVNAQVLPRDMQFAGEAHSHQFPSVAQVNIELSQDNEGTVLIALSSSDGSGSSSTIAAADEGVWIVDEPIFMGTGWGADSDPFTKLAQQRSLIISDNGKTATYQDMGADIHLELTTGRSERSLVSRDGMTGASVGLRGRGNARDRLRT